MRTLIVVASLFVATRAEAQEIVHPWELAGQNIVEIFGWPELLFHVGAGLVTAPLAFGGIDGAVQSWFQEEDPLGGRTPAMWNLRGGFYSPIVISAGIYLGGLVADEPEFATAGSAVTQAVVLTAVSVLTLKRLTDRGAPYRDGIPPDEDDGPGGIRRTGDPEDFRGDPSEYEDGIMWPSGHTASHFAIAAALSAFYPDEHWIPAVTYPLALLMGLYMIEGDFHWLSDVVAGAMIGHVIGWVIGANFREEYDRRNDGTPAVEELRTPELVSFVFPVDL